MDGVGWLTDPRAIFVLAIGGLFIIGFVSALANIIRYASTESNALGGVAQRLAQELKPAAGATETDGPRTLVSISRLRETSSGRTIIGDRLASLEKLRAAHTKINMAGLQQMTLAREAATRSLALPGLLANMCMMAGLLGTVFGLSIMLQQVGTGLPQAGTAITFESMRTSAAQISEALVGMKTAFSATLAGLIAAMALALVNQRLSRSQAKFLNLLDRFTVEDLLPATIPATEDESLLERVSMQLDASFERLEGAVKDNRSTLEQLGTVEKTLIEIVNSVRDARTAAEVNRVEDLVGPLTRVIEQVTAVNAAVRAVTDSVPVLIRESQAANLLIADRIEKAVADSRRATPERGPLTALKLACGCLALSLLIVILVVIKRP